MEVSAAAVADTAAGAAVVGGAKSPEAETETPTQIQPRKGLSLTNGVLKRHQQHHHHHHHHHFAAPQVVVAYKECLKNHAASLGGHALDGCGEFMPSPTATSADPTSLKCAACGCHRNFHRREPDDPPPTTHVIEYQPHHRHQPPPPPQRPRSPNSPSPPPISSSYYPSAPHMLLALSAGISGPPENAPPISSSPASAGANGRKRFRTKFSQGQKEKMFEFAEKVGWKMQKRDEELVAEFCNEVGVDKGVLKVWMHNNKNTFAKRDVNGGRTSLDDNNHNENENENENENDNRPHAMEATHHTPNHNHHNSNPNSNTDPDDDDNTNNNNNNNDTTTTAHLATNGSSSSS